MPYSEEEIKKYMNILHNYTKSPENETSQKTRCWNCCKTDFDLVSGFKMCENCGSQNEYVLGYFDKKDQERLYFRKKSIYQRKYHYEKRVNQVSKRLKLTEDEKYNLYSELMAIDDSVMEILNKQFCRKRMISIFYLMKKILEKMGKEKYKLIYLNIGDKTLANYEKWWNSYKSISDSSVKTPVNNSS